MSLCVIFGFAIERFPHFLPQHLPLRSQSKQNYGTESDMRTQKYSIFIGIRQCSSKEETQANFVNAQISPGFNVLRISCTPIMCRRVSCTHILKENISVLK